MIDPINGSYTRSINYEDNQDTDVANDQPASTSFDSKHQDYGSKHPVSLNTKANSEGNNFNGGGFGYEQGESYGNGSNGETGRYAASPGPDHPGGWANFTGNYDAGGVGNFNNPNNWQNDWADPTSTTTETSVEMPAPESFNSTEEQRGLAFVDTLTALESNPLGSSDASMIRSNPELAGQLGRIVGANPDPSTAEFRAGTVFASGIRAGDMTGGAGSDADTHLTGQLMDGQISTETFTILAGDPAFLNRNNGSEDVYKERYTDQGSENIANGLEPTDGEDRTYTSRDGLMFKVPDAAGENATPYFVTENGDPIPADLQALADGEGNNGGMSDLTKQGIGVIGGTLETTPEEDSLVTEYLSSGGQNESLTTQDFLTGIQSIRANNGTSADFKIEEDAPFDSSNTLLPESWATGNLYPEVVVPLKEQFVENGEVTDQEGLMAAINERNLAPDAKRYVYQEVTGQPMALTDSSIPLAPVRDERGEVIIEPDRRQTLDGMAGSDSMRLTDHEDFTMETLKTRLDENVASGQITEVEAEYIIEKVGELQLEPVDSDANKNTDHWERAPTPFITEEQKAGYTADIEQLKSYNDEGMGNDGIMEAIEFYMPDASPQEKDYLLHEATDGLAGINQPPMKHRYAEPQEAMVVYGLSSAEHNDAEAIINDAQFRINDGATGGELVNQLEQAETDGLISADQLAFIIDKMFEPSMTNVPPYALMT